MFEKLGRDARRTVKRGRELALARGSADVEVEHFLLALVEEPAGRAGAAIASLGLTSDAVSHAMDRELVGALAAAGVDATSRRSSSSPSESRAPRWGQSAKLTLKRALVETLRSGDRTIHDHHLLLAIVSAEAGRVPRLLDELGINADDVRAVLDD
jgi:ATP-dependent Clp protease ATP-binding subunit ClpA